MSNEFFWLIVWWCGWFFLMLFWYEAKKKEPLDLKVAFMMFVLSGFTPLIAIWFAIKKLADRDK